MDTDQSEQPQQNNQQPIAENAADALDVTMNSSTTSSSDHAQQQHEGNVADVQSAPQSNAVSSGAEQKAEEAPTTTNFISQPVPSTMNDDVYEFKSSPEDNAASMLLNPDAVRATTNSNYMSSNFETRYGLDEEADLMDEDEGNLIVDEQMETDEFEDRRRSGRGSQSSALPTFEIERCDDDEDEEMDEEQRRAEERRKVPPLRIVFSKNSDDTSKTLSPSISAGPDGQQSTSATPNRKRAAKKTPTTGTEKRGASSTRITRGQLAKQTVDVKDGGTGSLLSGKRPRATRRNVVGANTLNTVATRALTPKREREVSQAPSTSSAIQNDQAGTSMPPSPDANSRSSGGAASENDPALNLQPERLSFAVTNLFNQSDLGAYSGLKKMLHQRWAHDFNQHQRQLWTPAQYKSVLVKRKNKKSKLIISTPQQPKSDGSSVELMENQENRQRHLRKQQAVERHQLAGFIEREFQRQLNDVPSRSRTAITCMRVLADNDIYNANVMDINTDELNKIQSKSRDEIVAQVRKQLEVHANNTLKRHSIEADSLYFEQCAEWERFVADQIPMDMRARLEDFSLRNCVKRVKTKAINLDRIIR